MSDFHISTGMVLPVAAGLFLFTNSVIMSSSFPKTFALKVALVSQLMLGSILILLPVLAGLING